MSHIASLTACQMLYYVYVICPIFLSYRSNLSVEYSGVTLVLKHVCLLNDHPSGCAFPCVSTYPILVEL